MTVQTKQDKLLMHPRRSEVAEIAQYLVEMGEAEEGQDGWYVTFDHKIDQMLELINSEVLSVLEEIKIPTINDVFPEKPFDGTNTYTDMKQVVDYYESQIQSIKNRYKL